MVPVKAFLLFTVERIRCALLALATIVLLKMAAVTLFAPILQQIAPGAPQAFASSYAPG